MDFIIRKARFLENNYNFLVWRIDAYFVRHKRSGSGAEAEHVPGIAFQSTFPDTEITKD
jgi:hypothetical protein